MSPLRSADDGVEHCSRREIRTCRFSCCFGTRLQTQRYGTHKYAVSGSIVAVERNEMILCDGGGVQVCEDAGFEVKDLMRVTARWSFDC